VIFSAIRGKILFVMMIAKQNVSVNCPVCYSGNTFDLTDTNRAALLCEDCKFVLSENKHVINSGRCIFCGNGKFFIEFFLSLPILGSSSLVCYVCEAKYKGFKKNAADEKFDTKTALRLENSAAAVNLRERVKRYNES